MEILLSGPDWKFLDFVPYKALGEKVHSQEYDWSVWPNAVVPGNVQLDLLRNGMLEDPYLDFNSQKIEWVAARQWVYAKKFSIGGEFECKRVILRFEGIDYSAGIYFNSEHLGDIHNLFIPAEFDITDRIRCHGDNTIVVIIDPAPNEYAQAGWTSKVKTFKPRMNYGWDFAARCIPLGIWKDVKLIAVLNTRITDCWTHAALSDDLSQGSVELVTSLDSASDSRVTVESSILRNDDVVQFQSVEIDVKPGEQKAVQSFSIENPDLWWPNGHGDPSLYEAHIIIKDAETGELLDERKVTFGFKRVRLLPTLGVPEGRKPWNFEVNGKRIFVKGWNWVPIDELYGGKYAEKLERLIRLAVEANVNLLRIWGGGIIETESFYELCDRYGIMVWQEFPLSSSGIDSLTPTDPDYLNELKCMAEAVIPSRRNYASHTVWCLGNELKWTGEEDTAMRLLHNIVNDLDPEKPYLPTSPLWTGLPGEDVEIDIHGMWWYQGTTGHYTMYNQRTPAFHSEFGTEGAANFENIERFIREAKLTPITVKNPIYRHRGKDWLGEATMKTVFGDISEPETYFKLSQFIQWEGLRYIVESGRRRKYKCGGTIPWQFNEPWPNLACTNCVDYYTDPKMAYYAVAKAYAPVHVSAKYDSVSTAPGTLFTAELYANNSNRALENCRLEWTIRGIEGEVLAQGDEAVSLPENSAVRIGQIEWAVPEDFDGIFILFLRLIDAGGTVLSDNPYIFSSASEPIFAGLINPPETHIKVLGSSYAVVGGGAVLAIEIMNAGDCCAMFVRAAAQDNRQDVYFTNNYLVLAPGERSVIEAFLTKPISQFKISGWNTNSEVVP